MNFYFKPGDKVITISYHTNDNSILYSYIGIIGINCSNKIGVGCFNDTLSIEIKENRFIYPFKDDCILL